MTPLFLTADELHELTGYTVRSKQIAQLRTMGIAFRINGCGRAVVTRAAVEGSAPVAQQQGGWQPAVLQNLRKAA